jgi:hypothetical protein
MVVAASKERTADFLVQLMFVPVALAFYASLVSHNWMPKSPFTAVAGELPAQLEVLVSSLFTIATWRGSYAALRPYI